MVERLSDTYRTVATRTTNTFSSPVDYERCLRQTESCMLRATLAYNGDSRHGRGSTESIL